jgi:hypothetical protein
VNVRHPVPVLGEPEYIELTELGPGV